MRKRHTIKKYNNKQARTKRKTVTRRRRRKSSKKKIQRGGKYNETEVIKLKTYGFTDAQIEQLHQVQPYIYFEFYETLFNENSNNRQEKSEKINGIMVTVNNLINRIKNDHDGAGTDDSDRSSFGSDDTFGSEE